MLKTNEKNLISVAVQGKVSPAVEWLPFEITHTGTLEIGPSTGSIIYNVKVGDSAFGWQADHIEPGVSTTCSDTDKYAQRGYNTFACVGNEAMVISGDAKGKKGVVTGMHGGVEHVIIDFPHAVLEKLTMDDKFLIRAYGQGLKLLDYPDVTCYNLDPALLKKMPIREVGGRVSGKKVLEVGVTTIVPAKLMGSGIGHITMTRGDYDITTQDPGSVKKYGLDKIRLGDLVAVTDADNRYGRSWSRGAVSIGIVVHANSWIAGHGPGITTLLTTKKPVIKAVLNAHANIAEIMKIGSYRR